VALTTDISGASPPNSLIHPLPIDHHYETLRVGMRDLFIQLGIAG
jgi:hypothetical protein